MNPSFAEASGSGSTSAAQQLLRAALDSNKVSDSQVSQYYKERLQDRRIQITNLDRARPKTGGNDTDARIRAERKLVKRRRRIKGELSELKRLRIACGRSAKHPTAAAHQSEERQPVAKQVGEHVSATKELVKSKQRLLSDATKQLKRLRSTPRQRINQAKKIDKACQKPLSRSQRKRMGLEQVGVNISYELVKPLHDMWRSYIQQLLNIVAMNGKGQLVPNPQFDPRQLATMSSGTVSAIQASLIKADLCGAEIEVVRAANPSLVSQHGLVVKETEHTFIIAVPPQQSNEEKTHKLGSNATRTIPKKNAVLAIKIPLASSHQTSDPGHLRFELHGNHMMHTLPSRATRKYKARPTIDF
ncbi:related to POP4 - protein involved in processing of tRNAs and rRNAs [Melanopsichium pennsylvanicum]|uniref:Related to POP4 - protein involved in processing of tRNAs and rRNAs n=2 Tax=Melanopsichium pennsylvanicum TaxID=63383 RepID=A0AAJ5C3K1_9BASI|nr:related to POP4-protein involved in processing of tRNAs and rRNAs [Melanopsichium pennsylvanicum 4]SNX82529.1 related to POP4 - protein involved in processing of tRNAs and rRNAs [Melanopsichium pennsylvanicum]